MEKSEKINGRQLSTAKRKKKVLEEFEKCHAIVSVACQNAGIDQATYYKYLKNDSVFAAKIDVIKDSAIDYVESKLFELIEGVKKEEYDPVKKEWVVYKYPPCNRATTFYLKTKGKHKGFQEHTSQEMTITGNFEIQKTIYHVPDNGRNKDRNE
jgi:hypothetical protein